MAQAILVGDEIALNGERYPVVSADVWGIASGAFRALLTESLQTLRAPAIANGMRGDMELNLSNLACTPLLPFDVMTSGIQITPIVQAPHLLRQVFVATDTDTMMRLVVQDLDVGS